MNIVSQVRPSLLRLADMSEDTVLFSVRSNCEAICVDRATGGFPIRANFLRVGSRRPLGIGGGSMALLAALPSSERDAVLAITLGRISEYPSVTAEALTQHIEHYDKHGYVAMYDLIVDKMAAVGLPVIDNNGHLRGSISIVALSERIRSRETELIDSMRTEVDQIVKTL